MQVELIKDTDYTQVSKRITAHKTQNAGAAQTAHAKSFQALLKTDDIILIAKDKERGGNSSWKTWQIGILGA